MVICQFERLSLRERLILIMDHASWIARDDQRRVTYYKLRDFHVAVQLDHEGRKILAVTAFEQGMYYHWMMALLVGEGLS